MSDAISLYGLLQAIVDSPTLVDVESLRVQWTPFFFSDVLLPRTSWLGRVVAWIWNQAEYFGLASEKRAMNLIIERVKKAFVEVMDGARPFQDPLTSTIVLMSYIMPYQEKIASCAESLLGCRKEIWREKSLLQRQKSCLSLVNDLTPCGEGEEVVDKIREQDEEKRTRDQRKRWIGAIQRKLRYMPSKLIWEALWSKCPCGHSREESLKPYYMAEKLLKEGLRLDLVDEGPIEGPSQGCRQPLPVDERFGLSINNTAKMQLVAKNGFLIPLWRIHAASLSTLFPVVSCGIPDSSKRIACIEPLQGLFLKMGYLFPPLLEKMGQLLSSWFTSRVPLHPNADDVWVTCSGNLVTFAPVGEEKGHFSAVDAELFLHRLCRQFPKQAKRELFRLSGFYSIREVARLIEWVLEPEWTFSFEPLSESLAQMGFVDEKLFQVFFKLVKRLQNRKSLQENSLHDSEWMRRYCSLAFDEGSFFFPSEELFDKLLTRTT